MRKVASVLFLTGCLLGSAYAGERFSFRIQGGWASTIGGEINETLSSRASLIRNAYPVFRGGFDPLRSGTEAGIEAIFHVSSRWALGLGVGRLQGKSRGTAYGGYSDTDWTQLALNPSFSSVIISLSGYSIIPLSSRIRCLAGLGLGYLPTTLSLSEETRIISDRFSGRRPGVLYNQTIEFQASRGLLGFLGSINLEIDLASKLAVFFGARFRSVSGTKWNGDANFKMIENGIPTSESKQDHQSLWIYNYQPQIQGGPKYRLHVLAVEKPPASIYQPWMYSDAHEAKLNLSGVSLGLGIRIKL